MRQSGHFWILIVVLLASCQADMPLELERKKGDEDTLLARYSGQLTAQPRTQGEIDQNRIVNYLLDSLYDFQRTNSGIYYQIHESGTGTAPNAQSVVKTHYHGTLLDGKVFDSSYRRGRPIEFELSGVVVGWQQSIPMLKPGGKGTFIIPSALAYGAAGRGKMIPPHSILIFDIELISFQ